MTSFGIKEQSLNALGASQEAGIRRAMVGNIKRVRQSYSDDYLLSAAAADDIDDITNDLEDAVTDAVHPHLRQTFAVTSAAAISLLGPMLGGRGGAARGAKGASNLRLRFDPSNPDIAKYIATRTGHLITATEEGVREVVNASAIKAAVSDAIVGGSSAQVAARIRGSIGLTRPQVRAQANAYMNALQEGMPVAQAARQAAVMSDKQLSFRAQVIARTEVRNAQNQAQLDIWQQGVDEGMIHAAAKKVWVVDGAPCPEWCEQMDGVAVGLDEQWTVTNTVTGETQVVDNPSATHVNCLCSASLSDFA